jgi:hypothetical protein
MERERSGRQLRLRTALGRPHRAQRYEPEYELIPVSVARYGSRRFQILSGDERVLEICDTRMAVVERLAALEREYRLSGRLEVTWRDITPP